MEQLTLANISGKLTEDVIEQVFKAKTNSNDSVVIVEVSRAAPPGEGLMSAVYRIKITGTNLTASIIAKGLVKDPLLRTTLKCTEFFKREIVFFSEILPIFINTQKSLGGEERIQKYIPMCYGCYLDGKDDYILIEDLHERECASLSQQLTLSERDMTLKVLAHFHSVSIAMRVKKPDLFAQITNGLYEFYYSTDNRDWAAQFFQKAIGIYRSVILEVEGADSVYYKKFDETMKRDVYGELIRLAATRGDHPVLNHGDAWSPNFLCCGNAAIAIDFQLVRCVSVASDLTFFLLLCGDLCRNKEGFYEAIDVYYKALEYYLKDMGIDSNEVFSLDILKSELKKYGRFGVYATVTSLLLLASTERCDVLQSFEVKFAEYERIPLDKLWPLSPIIADEHKMRLASAIRVAVDVGLI